MSGEDQERFEDYLELERYIEELQAGRVAHPPKDLTPSQASIYRMAALFRSVSPEAAMPRPEFVEDLRARLLALDEEDEEITLKRPAIPNAAQQEAVPVPAQHAEEPQMPTEEPVPVQAGQQEQEVQPPPLPQRGVPKKVRFVSRRSLLTGSAVAAASLAVGTGIGAAVKQAASTPAPTGRNVQGEYKTPLVQSGEISTQWHLVTTVAALGDKAVKFVTDSVIGYIIRNDGDDTEAPKGAIIAMSAACTHMGCIVKWQESDNRFHCPCHGGVFTEYGKPDPSSRMRYLVALPRLKTKVENGNIYVEVPVSNI